MTQVWDAEHGWRDIKEARVADDDVVEILECTAQFDTTLFQQIMDLQIKHILGDGKWVPGT